MNLRPFLLQAALLIACIAGVWVSRAPWLGREIWNLDEGSTFIMAHQVMDGDVLYRDAADNRSPLVPYIKAMVFGVFGSWNALAVHLLITVLIGLSAYCVSIVARTLGGWRLALPSLVTFLYLQIFWIDLGDAMSANTEWFVIAFSTTAFAVFVKSVDRPSLPRGLLVGALFGGAVLCKQPGLLDMVVALVLLVLIGWKSSTPSRGQLFKFGASLVTGTLLPLGFFSLYFALKGAWADYIYYAFTFNTEVYIPEVSFWERKAAIRMPFLMAYHNAPLFGLLGIIAAGSLLARALPQLHPKRSFELAPWLILGWTFSGLVSTTLSGREFAHYSEQVIPGLSLAVAWLVAGVWNRTTANGKPWGKTLLLSGSLAALVLGFMRFHQIRSEVAGIADEPHPMGNLAQQFSKPEERLFVWGYFPEIYFYARRLPSTRFIYTNYLTGMIAWTNLDPFMGVEHGITPGAQDQFESDFSRRPPAVIVDTNDLRGYVRFPIEERSWLWQQITQNYAQVAAYSMRNHRMRIFRRHEVLPIDPATIEQFAASSVALSIGGVSSLRPGALTQLEAEGPSQLVLVHLFSGQEILASLPHAAAEPMHIRFFAPESGLRSQQLWVGAETIDGRLLRSPLFDFEQFVRASHVRKIRQPKLSFPEVEVVPEQVASQLPTLPQHNNEPDLWRFKAPGFVRFRISEEIQNVSFEHGIVEAMRFHSDGYDVWLNWLGDDGQTTTIWRRRMEPRKFGKDQMAQIESVDLPPRGPGRLEFRFTNGADGNANDDHLFFGRVKGYIDRPTLRIGSNWRLSERDSEVDYIRGDGGNWLMHAPASISWARPPNLMQFSFNYGIEAGAYQLGDKGHTDGVIFSLDLETTDGETITIWSDTLTPFNHPEDRGVLSATVDLPPMQPGRLVLSTQPGAAGDTSWDWAFGGDFRGTTPGPPIKLADGRALYSVANRGYNEGWSDQFDEKHWGAQSPQELDYPKPPELAALTIRFGINPDAAQDPEGNRRSDGVHVRVFFDSDTGETTEVFERFLDPYSRPDDAGEHEAKFATRPGESGILRVRMEPGPHNNNSFDWAFWGAFEGSTIP